MDGNVPECKEAETVGVVGGVGKHKTTGRNVWFRDPHTSSDDEYIIRRRHKGVDGGDVEARSTTPDFEPSISTAVDSPSDSSI